MRLVYADDSGDDRGLALYAFIEVQPEDWAPALRVWIALRHAMRDEYGIPTRYELHAVHFLGGRGNPSCFPVWNRDRAQRLRVGERITASLASLPVRLRVVYVNSRHRRVAYRASLGNLDRDLARSGDLALVMVDGNGSDRIHLEAHRSLPIEHRRIIEDPWHQGSQTNQWIMMADWAAYLAFQSLRRNNREVGDWYTRYLSSLDVHGMPVQG